MSKKNGNIDKGRKVGFDKEYEEIIKKSSSRTVVVKIEWQKDGDFFEKLTMYDDSYLPVQTLGGTTLLTS